jgi:hypothetical protein
MTLTDSNCRRFAPAGRIPVLAKSDSFPQSSREHRQSRQRRFRMWTQTFRFLDFLRPSCPRCFEPVAGLPNRCACCHEPLEGNPAWEQQRKKTAWILLAGPVGVFATVISLWPHA